MNENNVLAVGSLVTAVIAWLIGGLGSCALVFLFLPASFCTWVIFLGGSVTAVLFGHQGRSQIRNSEGQQTGENLALIGLGMGWAGIAINLLMLCLIVTLVVAAVLLGPEIENYLPSILSSKLFP